MILLCPKHGDVIDRDQRVCATGMRHGIGDCDGDAHCLMAARGGQPFSDFELDWWEHLEAHRSRLLEDPTPLGPDERDALAYVLTCAWQDFLFTGPHADTLPQGAPDA